MNLIQKTFVISFCFLFLSIVALAQDYKNSYNKGVRAYNRRAYPESISFLKETLKLKPDMEHAWYLTAMAQKNLKHYKEASYAFKKIEYLNPDFNSIFYLEAGKMYVEMGEFSSAKKYLRNYLKKTSKSPKNTLKRHVGYNRLKYAELSRDVRVMSPTTSDPVEVSSINSSSNDLTPQVSPTGTKMYFTSSRSGGVLSDSGKVAQDIFYSDLVNGQWSTPQLMPAPINSDKDDFGASFSGDGQTMVYVRCGEKESVGNCDLYITHLKGTKWTEPVNMGNVVNSPEWDSQPTISSDGTRIIFASARKGGYGGIDLYMTSKNQYGQWGVAVNLGSIVNTPFKDSSPYLAPDGKSLYYASNGHPGYGGQDIFFAVFNEGRWMKPQNVGAPINSSGDDKNFTTSASGKAYFASSRLDPKNYDIFEVELPEFLKPEPSLVIQGLVKNSNNDAPIEAVVMVEDLDNGEMLALNKSNSITGEYLVVLPVGRNYSVSASKDGYFFYSQSFDLPKDTSYLEITKDILLEPIEKGTKVVLNNIFFESGRAELKPISYVELNKAVDLMKKNSTMVIEIGGHTDNVGAETLNLKLSQSRAEAVKDYMKLAGIDDNRLQAKGYGESMPIADNTTKEGKKANRRTEFVIVEF
ncbi:OmpA family protein [Reichenbachiella versicolor]|uniref:OmpA family protein n=1 Tax=Reichenbachiella versicolor TaxID=1821036 RepID=UPI000D6E7C6B|nr:OmpA family protein [Reichenbachiella versicolor]